MADKFLQHFESQLVSICLMLGLEPLVKPTFKALEEQISPIFTYFSLQILNHFWTKIENYMTNVFQ